LSAIIAFGAAPAAFSQSLFDVFFLTDTTGSMGSLIDGVQSSSTSILDAFLVGRNVVFGVGEYKDDNSDSFGFRYNLTTDGLPTFTSSREPVVTAINEWGASGGGDLPEDNLFGLREVASTAPWRAGSRRIIYWFGDAEGLDPASDGTTLETTLAALSANCVEVIAIDLGRLDETGQATAITTATLSCGREGGEIIELDLFGLTPEEAAALILRTLSENFGGLTGGGNGPLLISANLGASITLNRTMTRDVGGRLFRMRAGIQPEMTVMSTPPPSAGAKGAKVVMESVTSTYSPQWEVWGQMFYSDDSRDGQTVSIPGAANLLVNEQTDTDIFGGTIGAEYRTGAFAFGFAVSYGEADVSVNNVGDTDIDGFALIPYVSYYRANAFAGADFYADALYAYGDYDYKTTRNAFTGSTEGNAHQLEFNTGVNFKSPKLVHGPYAQLRWLDGEVDGYSEDGGGLTYADTDYESLATQLGYQVSFPMQVQGGMLVPQLTAAWEHEFEEDMGSIGGIPLGEVDEDLAVLGAGIGYYASSGWNLLLNYEARLGDLTENHYVGLKFGKEF
jgi:hypothetical protein